MEKKLMVIGEINQRTVDYFYHELLECNKIDRINLLINSTGGSITATFSIYELIRVTGAEIHTTVVGNCMSAANVLFALGKTRIISKGSTYMMHEPSVGISAGSHRLSEYKQLYLELQDDLENIKKILQATCPNNLDELFEKAFASGENYFMPPEEVLKWGLATEIIDTI